MAHKKNGKSKTNQTTTLQQKNDANVSAKIKLAGKSAQTPDSGNQAASEVVIQQQQINVAETLCETGISKEEITNNIDKLHKIGKTDKNNTQNTIIKFKSHSFKEKIYFKGKAIKQRDVKIKPSLTKHRIELLKDANTLITDNHGTNFLFAYADVHGNLKIRLKDARNRREVVRFVKEKDFNNLFARSF